MRATPVRQVNMETSSVQFDRPPICRVSSARRGNTASHPQQQAATSASVVTAEDTAFIWRPTAPALASPALPDNTQTVPDPPNALRVNSGKHRRTRSIVAPRCALRGNTVYFAAQVKSAATRARLANSALPKARQMRPRATRARLVNQETSTKP